VTLEAIEAVLGGTVEVLSGHQELPSAPGQSLSHYAPATPLRLLPGRALEDGGDGGVGLLAFRNAPGHHHYGEVEVLSASGDLAEAAARLFDCLHRLDGQRLDWIEAERVPPEGLGRAINDRLERAAAKS
jgi:L-threonylcarbamoyladenylate synthase